MLKNNSYTRIVAQGLILLAIFAIYGGCKKSNNDPYANFSVSNSTPTIDELVRFTNTSTNAHHIKWTFPNGTTATSNTVSYSFYPNGIYQVKLEAFNSNETATDFYTKDISVCISGKVVFYTDSLNFKGPIDIVFNKEFAGSLSTFNLGIPNCGQPGAVTVDICPGIYSYEATGPNNKTWKSSVKISTNGCTAVKLN
jgi:PKD repeat protein